MKKTITIIGLLINLALYAQSSSVNEMMAAKGYTYVPKDKSSANGVKVDIGSVDFYDGQGNAMSTMEGMGKLSAGGNNTVDLYADKDKNVRALVIREAETGEKKAKIGGSYSTSSALVTGQPVPAFSITGMDGKNYTSEQLKGKIVVLNFWFEQCKPCIEEMPALNKIADSYKDNSDIVFLAVTFDQKKDIEKFLQKNKFTYQTIPDQREMIQQYGITMFPTHLVIDRDGKLFYMSNGLSGETTDELRTNITNALSKR